MVKYRRVEHPERGRKRSQGPETRLTAQSRTKRRKLDDAPQTQILGDFRPSRRRSLRETVRTQTKASELSAVARHSRARQLPLAGGKRTRTSGSSAQRSARRGNPTAHTQQQEQQQRLPGGSSDSEPVQGEADAFLAQTLQVDATPNTDSRRSLKQRKGSRHNKGQGGSARVARNRQLCAAKQKAPAKPAQHDHAPPNEQPADDSALGAQTQTPDSPMSQGQQSPRGRKKRRPTRTHGTPHATFTGVKTSTAGIKHRVVHPDVKQVWSAFVMVPGKLKYKDVRMCFLGKNYWTAEAAARAVDRANIALYGREAACTNFPLEWYGEEEVQRHGDELEAQLKALAGMKNNNPRRAPGVPYTKWQPAYIPCNSAKTLREKNPDWQPKPSNGKLSVDPAFALQLWERLTGGSASQTEDPDVQWFKKVCGHCQPCRQAARRRAEGLVPRKKGISCTALPKLRVAKQHLTRLAKQSGQRRFAPADLDAFLASLPDTPSDTVPEAGHGRPQGSRDNPSDRSDVENGDGEEARRMGDALFVPEERRGGPRQKGLSKSIRAMLKGKQRRVSPGLSDEDSADDEEQQLPTQLRRGRSQGLRSGSRAERAVTWTDVQLSTLQVREDALYEAQEHNRVVAADAAPHRGTYQPLLAAPPPGPEPLDRLKWPDHHAADLRHIQRCAQKGKLVEVRNHDWWGPPALGTLGPPAAALQGFIGHQPTQQQFKSVPCCWCKAEDHLVKDCPLNSYLDEQMEGSPEEEAHLVQHAAARAEQLAQSGEKQVPAEWLSEVSKPMREVMSAMQQMASAGAQANIQKHLSHSSVTQSMTPDALLACGLLVDELMKSQLQG